VLGANGAPTPPFATRLIPPASRMGPLTDAELAPHLATRQVKKYARAVDRESARETLAERASGATSAAAPPSTASAGGRTARAKEEPSAFEKILKSPLTRSVATQLTRSLMGALLGPPRRRRF
ncbi:MAG: DUF853 family protein, partial [Deltaproteobacteria bacterium]|nr:DUF853 family protein [Deltaproteobacteria bacterium]